MAQWFAVQTKPRAEAIARAHLERQGYHCLFPRIRRIRPGPDGLVDRIEALFPRYLFIEVDTAVVSLAPVRSTRGACGIVRFGSRPAPVPEAVITNIRSREDAQGLVQLRPPELTPGARVRVSDGPFAGLVAVFESFCGSERVRLLLDAMGVASRVVVPRDQLGAML